MSNPSESKKGRLHFVANCMYGTHLAGGDVHFFEMARAAVADGWTLHFFGGHALQHHLRKEGIPAEITLTDAAMLPPINAESLGGQLRLLWDYFKRLCVTLHLLWKIQPEDVAYAVTDYWFDVWPVLFSQARRKLMIWHMQAPTLMQVLRRSRADVDAKRLASLYFWASQNISLGLFRFCRNKHLYYINPVMLPELLRLGFERQEVSHLSFGVDISHGAPETNVGKKYDVVWIGRIHRQKGIEDLVATLSHLAKVLPGFRAVIMGKVREELQPQLAAASLIECVDLPGFVADDQKWRLFHQSRVFLMPSRFEGAPRVIGEALVSGVSVVAYAVDNYEPVYAGRLLTVPCFDLEAFKSKAEETIRALREGSKEYGPTRLEEFRRANSWMATRERFLMAIDRR